MVSVRAESGMVSVTVQSGMVSVREAGEMEG